MNAEIKLTKDDINAAIIDYIAMHYGISISSVDIRIQVKSKQNYRSEWEEADYRAEFIAQLKK